MEAKPTRGLWPSNPVIYQIYPRSFQDTTGTGEGDLAGVTKRLRYVAELGVDAIWLSPFFTSPLCDGGYDVADQMSVDPRFGTLDDFDALVARARELGLCVMIDQVFNHTSDTHVWFQKSLAGEGDYADYYVWADARPDGSPPSNWIGYFGRPAWRWYPQRAQYCLSQFLPCQPGLNHHNPKVLAELASICAFWRDRGVDGFRFDAVTTFFFDRNYPDNPAADGEDRELIPGPDSNPFTMQRHEYDMLPKDCAAFAGKLREWSGDDAFLLGEINQGPRSVELTRAFAKADRLDAGYTIDLPEQGVSAKNLRDVLDRLDGGRGMAWWLSSHDQPRHVSREGDGSARDARLFAALLLALPGPLLLFQGEELGLPQVDLEREQVSDPFDLMYWPDAPGRAGARGPMVWTDGEGHGFSTQAPWVPFAVPQDGPADRQIRNDASVLSFYRRALRMRSDCKLGAAEVTFVDAPNDLIALKLTNVDGDHFGVVVNLSSEPVPCPFAGKKGAVLLESDDQPSADMIAQKSAVWHRLSQ